MIKKLSVTCACIVLLVLAAVPAAAQISYCKDFLEPGNENGSLKTFDEEWTLAQNETVEMNIWINNLPVSLLTAGCFIEFDPTLINITDFIPYDTENGGPWDPAEPSSPAPGQWLVTLINFNCVSPDEDGDILLAKVRFDHLGLGDAEIIIHTIPGFDTITDCNTPTIYDLQIPQNTITINKVNGTSTTTTGSGTTTTPTSTTFPSTTTSAGSSTTTTEPSSNFWQSAYAMMWGEETKQKLSLLRTFRNELVARNKLVRNYVSLLYQHSSEVAGVFIKNPLLCLETRKLVEVLLPSIESFFQTEQFSLTAGQKVTVESFLTQLELEVAPELKAIIQNFREDLNDGRLFLTVS
jgi:hypothetical protein